MNERNNARIALARRHWSSCNRLVSASVTRAIMFYETQNRRVPTFREYIADRYRHKQRYAHQLAVALVIYRFRAYTVIRVVVGK